MKAPLSRWLAAAGLVLLALLVAVPVNAMRLVLAVPLLALSIACLLGWRRWTITSAVLMLPWFSYGMMEVIVSPAGRARAIFFTLLTVGVLLAAFDASRRLR